MYFEVYVLLSRKARLGINQAWLPILLLVVVSHIQRIGCQPEKTTLHGGQSRSWSAEQGKKKKKKSLAAPPPPPRALLVRRKKKITRRIHMSRRYASRRYAGGRDQLNKKKLFSLSLFAPENLVSRDGFGRPVPRQRAQYRHQGESDWLVLDLRASLSGTAFAYTINRHRV